MGQNGQKRGEGGEGRNKMNDTRRGAKLEAERKRRGQWQRVRQQVFLSGLYVMNACTSVRFCDLLFDDSITTKMER